MVAVSLNKQIDDVFSGYSKLETPEERKEHKVEGSLMFEGFEELVKIYLGLFEIEGLYPFYANEAIINDINEVLAPEQINAFLQATAKYDTHRYYDWCTGLLISKLIRNSYNSGYNDFYFNTRSLERIEHLGKSIQGKPKEPIKVTIDGDVGSWCGDSSRYSIFEIKGNAEFCCGGGSYFSTYIIGGEIEGQCGCHPYSDYGGKMENPRGLIFKTRNKENLPKIIHSFSINKIEGCKAYFINGNGEEELVWDK
ncbi:MAG: hypothetical protein ABIB71_06410 [Candidatus Woesearchaeota archaeon]